MPNLPRLVVLFGADAAEHEVGSGTVAVGSAADDGIAVRSAGLSPRHFRLIGNNGRYWIEDAGGSAGTFLNGVRVTGRLEIRGDGIIFAGGVCFHFAREARPGAIPPIATHGVTTTEIRLPRGTITIGRDHSSDVIVASPEISQRHLRIEAGPDGARVVATNDIGECRINGQHFDQHHLILGDQLDLGVCRFQFDGDALRIVDQDRGAELIAQNLTHEIDGHRLLDRVSLRIAPNEFVGVIGPTGAGKSSLLAAMSGLRPAATGRVLLNGNDLYSNLVAYRRQFGWVPQEDIVHRELTVLQALNYAARLRLPRETPENDLARLVMRTAKQLGLERNMGSIIGNLSGGQIKKVSVGAELLSRPSVMFLDEPTSGLDPGTEAVMMGILRQLADSGCTTICTTHKMQSVYLLDRLVVMAEGMMVFSGTPDQALEFFGVVEPEEIFRCLEERRPQEWRDAFLAWEAKADSQNELPVHKPVDAQRRRPTRQLPLLLSRQLAILASDWRNFAILIGQPLIIGMLLVWAVRGTLDDTALKLFFVYVATLWFGCSNGAQAIVGEMAIFRREHMVGLRSGDYVFAKWIFLSLVTLDQGLIMLLITRFIGDGVVGSLEWQLAGVGMMALVATALGLAISVVARNSMQAVLLVPFFIIPQIILSGYTIPAYVMKPSVFLISQVVPSFQMQRIMDVSLLWERTIDATTLQAHLQAFENINKDLNLKIGDQYIDSGPLIIAFSVLAAWLVLGYIFTVVALRFKVQLN